MVPHTHVLIREILIRNFFSSFAHNNVRAILLKGANNFDVDSTSVLPAQFAGTWSIYVRVGSFQCTELELSMFCESL